MELVLGQAADTRETVGRPTRRTTGATTRHRTPARDPPRVRVFDRDGWLVWLGR